MLSIFDRSSVSLGGWSQFPCACRIPATMPDETCMPKSPRYIPNMGTERSAGPVPKRNSLSQVWVACGGIVANTGKTNELASQRRVKRWGDMNLGELGSPTHVIYKTNGNILMNSRPQWMCITRVEKNMQYFEECVQCSDPVRDSF